MEWHSSPRAVRHSILLRRSRPSTACCLLAPLVRRWKQRLPAHVAAKFSEEFVVPASAADSIWLARDLAALIDEVETEGSDWAKLAGAGRRRACRLVAGDARFPRYRHRRLAADPCGAPALQSGGAPRRADPDRSGAVEGASASRPGDRRRLNRLHPATAELLSVIARLPRGAVVLPGLDTAADERSWTVLNDLAPEPSVLGHPQFGLAKLLRRIGITRADVEQLAVPRTPLTLRQRIAGEALRPASTTDAWARRRQDYTDARSGCLPRCRR